MSLIAKHKYVPAMDDEALEKVRGLEDFLLTLPQVQMPTLHTLHGGTYTRTIKMPAGVVLTGALIKIPTTIITHGDGFVYIGENTVQLSGYNVIPAAAGRKQAFVATGDLHITMVFATDASTVAEAEAQFTDEADRLFSRYPDAINKIIITGE